MNSRDGGNTRPALTHGGAFVLRTPLLPWEPLLAPGGAAVTALRAGAGQQALAVAIQADRDAVRLRLRGVLSRADVREALWLASPDLWDVLRGWERGLDNARGRRVERALIRYIGRMTARPTPFGLMAGWSVGRVGDHTNLALGPRTSYRRATRIAPGVVGAVLRHLSDDPEVRGRLTYRPSSTLYAVAGRPRFVEVVRDGSHSRTQLATAELDAPLQSALDVARPGTSLDVIAAHLAANYDVSHAEAAEFVHSLIDSQILESEFTPSTDRDGDSTAVLALLSSRAPDAPATQAIARALQCLARVNELGVGTDLESYDEALCATTLLAPTRSGTRALVTDLFKAAPDLQIGPDLLAEVQRGARLLGDLAVRRSTDALAGFRRGFIDRYGDREVPLTEVLDEDVGIGFHHAFSPGGELAPALQDVAWHSERRVTTSWHARDAVLLEKLTDVWRAGGTELLLSEEDVARLTQPEAAPLPVAFAVLGSFVAPAPGEDAWRFAVDMLSGPSGVRALGRVTAVDPDVHALVERHFAQEQSLLGDAVIAEVTYMPPNDDATVLARPSLRPYEIPYLNYSTLPVERQLPVSDLRLRVEGEYLRLRSARLGRDVIPRVTSVHNFAARGLGVYTFLASLQQQHLTAVAGWHWGPFESAPFLPRVVHHRVILARARWRVPTEVFRAAAGGADEALRFAELHQWRTTERVPRFVTWGDDDQLAMVDLEDPTSVDAMLGAVGRRHVLVFTEMLPAPDQLAVHASDGSYVHEVLVPIVQSPPAWTRLAGLADPGPQERVADVASGQATTSPTEFGARPDDRGSAAAEAPSMVPLSVRLADPLSVPAGAPREPSVPFRFEPGSEWLYVKVYCAPAVADHVLRNVVAPLLLPRTSEAAPMRGFFIRYKDPEWHVRVRIVGDPARLRDEVYPAFHAACASLLDDGRVWRLTLDTYEREVRRYGGERLVEAAEHIFHADSTAVLSILTASSDADLAEHRFWCAVLGVDALLADFGCSLEERRAITAHQASAIGAALGYGNGLRGRFATAYRAWRPHLTRILVDAPEQERAFESDSPVPDAIRTARRAFRERSQAWQEAARAYRRHRDHNALEMPFASILASFAHMHVNRVLRDPNPRQELGIFHFLAREYESRIARAQS